MNPLACGTMLVRFLALELWLMASCVWYCQIVDWMRVRAATPESLDEKYFVAAGDHWLIAAIVLGLLGVLVYSGTAPLTRWLAGER